MATQIGQSPKNQLQNVVGQIFFFCNIAQFDEYAFTDHLIGTKLRSRAIIQNDADVNPVLLQRFADDLRTYGEKVNSEAAYNLRNEATLSHGFDIEI